MANNNGYDFVDLELPSKTLWATSNIGASKPTDFGRYFQWGDTVGYDLNQIGKDKQFTLDDYKFYNGSGFVKYIDKGATLDLEDDAAHILMCGDWHMPSLEQIEELKKYTKHKKVKINDINGLLFTSKKNSSKSIFFPMTGYAADGNLETYKFNGGIWTSSLYSGYNIGAFNLDFFSNDVQIGLYSRFLGFPIRGVIG